MTVRAMARDTNFSYSFLVLPPAKRQAMVAVWDFCRAVDDEVDEPAEAGDPRGMVDGLDRWRREVEACFTGATPETRQGASLQPWIERFGLPREPFEGLIEGVAMDIGHRRYPTFDDLEQYCRRVASTVGLICLEIFGYQNPAARDYAVHLGLALQLTNILRDVGADLVRGRLYIPLDELRHFGVDERVLRAGRLSPAVVALLQHQASRCHTYFARARAALPPEDARRLVAAEIIAAIYAEILARIERRGFDVFSARVCVPRPMRALIALRTWARVAITSNVG